MSDPVEEFKELSRRIFEKDLSWEEVEELAYRWAGLKKRLSSGLKNAEPTSEEVEYLKRRILELRSMAGIDNPSE
ncbi:MAG: hypothetical protein QXO86_00480 [Nitrososphaerota archaeon]